MSSFFRLCAIYITLLSPSYAWPQEKNEEKTRFGPPLEIPIFLAGSFGELRNNHFHAGIDVKTQGVEGMKVLAVADGYVSRIKVSPFGYGLALYINHGTYTSVYGHLSKYNDALQAYVRKHQYAQKSYKTELFPGPGEFPVKKGDVVAISGNSGGSHAPHLHFEIRETTSEAALNPIPFGFGIKDQIPPVLERLYVYPKGEKSEVNGKNKRLILPFTGNRSAYFTHPNYRIETSGEVYFGIRLYDEMDEVYNHCGIYAIKLFCDSQLIFHHRMDRFAFTESRYVNAYADYEEKTRMNRWVNLSYILPNNKLKTYHQKESGVVVIPGGETRQFRYEVTDFFGNTSVGTFEAKGVEAKNNREAFISQKAVKHFKYATPNTYEGKDILVYLPGNVLYHDVDFTCWTDDTLAGTVSPVYNIHNKFTPLHSYIALSFRLASLPARLRKYATAVYLDNGNGGHSEGGYWKGDYFIVKTRNFGKYAVRLDSIPPRLTPVNISENADMSRKWSVIVKVEDNLSGLEKFDSYIDGAWVLTEFDYKNSRLIHYFEENLTRGKHEFRMEVADKIGNQSSFKMNFIR